MEPWEQLLRSLGTSEAEIARMKAQGGPTAAPQALPATPPTAVPANPPAPIALPAPPPVPAPAPAPEPAPGPVPSSRIPAVIAPALSRAVDAGPPQPSRGPGPRAMGALGSQDPYAPPPNPQVELQSAYDFLKQWLTPQDARFAPPAPSTINPPMRDPGETGGQPELPPPPKPADSLDPASFPAGLSTPMSPGQAAPTTMPPRPSGPSVSSGGMNGPPTEMPPGRVPGPVASSLGISQPQPEMASPVNKPADQTDWRTIIGAIGATLGMGPRRGETVGQLISRSVANGLMAQQFSRTSNAQRADAAAKQANEDRRTTILEKQFGLQDRRTAAVERSTDASIAATMARIGLIADERTQLQYKNEAARIALIRDPVKQELEIRKLDAQIEESRARTASLTEKPGEARAKAWQTAVKNSLGMTGAADPETLLLNLAGTPGLKPMDPAKSARFRAAFARDTAGMKPEQVQAYKLKLIREAYAHGEMLPGF